MDGLLRSKRFWLAVAGVVSVVLQDRIPLTEQQIQDAVMLIAAWILGDSVRSTQKRR